MIRFSCPQCKLVLQATEQKIGTAIACPKCAKRMKVPEGPTKAKIDDPNRATQHGFSVDQAVLGDWFYVKDKKKAGPVSLDDIKQMVAAGQLQSTDVIIKTGMQKWLPIHGVLDLLPQQPAAGAARYYYVHDKQKSGPISIQELKQRLGEGKLTSTDMVLKEGTQKWLAASTLTELFPAAPAVPARPAGDPSKDWYVIRNKQKSGPLPIAELRAMVGDGRLAPSDMVLKPGTQKYVTAEEVDELFGPAPVPEEVAKAATDKGPAVPERPRPAPAPAAAPARPAAPAPAAAASAPAGPRPSAAPAPSMPAAAAVQPAAPPPASPLQRPAAAPPSATGTPKPTSPSSSGTAKHKLPVPSVAPAPPPPLPDLPDDLEDETFEETPIPASVLATPRDEQEIDVEPVAAPAPARGKKRKGKKPAGSSKPLQMLLAAWLGVVLVRTMALLLYDPQLSLFLWPIEWLFGLGVAWLSFRRRLRLGVVVGLLGPALVLISMAAFMGLGLEKAEGLEYLRYVMVPFGVIALVLGYLVMQAAGRRGKPRLTRGKKGKRKRPPSSMRLAAARKTRPRDEEEDPDEESEIGALGRGRFTD